MECTIHRSDRPISTTAREYLAEVRYDSDIWKKMPRRMLRHRALQQCARLAFAINPPDGQIEKQQPEKSKQNPLEQQGDAEGYRAISAKNNLGGIEGLKMRLNGWEESCINPHRQPLTRLKIINYIGGKVAPPHHHLADSQVPTSSSYCESNQHRRYARLH